jgi:alkyl hydroperoxide reductase subunit AhpC
VRFPIIADEHRDVAWLYDMLPESATGSKDMVLTIRSVFIIDPNKKIRLSMTYPASTGRNSAEVLRVIDSLQTTDKLGLASPIDWQVGDDLIVPVPVSTEKAKEKFEDVREVRPYLRFTSGKGKSS